MFYFSISYNCGLCSRQCLPAGFLGPSHFFRQKHMKLLQILNSLSLASPSILKRKQGGHVTAAGQTLWSPDVSRARTPVGDVTTNTAIFIHTVHISLYHNLPHWAKPCFRHC